MDLTKLLNGPLGKLPPRAIDAIFRLATRVPPLRRRVEREYDEMLARLPSERELPGPRLTKLPATGLSPDDVTRRLELLAATEEGSWRDGFASGSVYHGDPGHIALLDRAYALHSQSNPLHADLWPSTAQLEAEIVAMTARLAGAAPAEDDVCGTVTSGGTESIILAMKAYRDRARVRRPQVVAPATAHVAFDKAAYLLGLELVKVPVGSDFRADPAATAAAISRRTIALVGSAPGFPHGVIDPIPELSRLAGERGIGFHTDACLGGFVLPFAARLGYEVPDFDFRLPHVTSLSIDTHKYGYAPKGSSVVLYRGRELRRHQYFVATEWPGGLYYSPTLAGSRPGGLSAAAWAALAAVGDEGYLAATQAILDTAARIRAGIEAMAGIEVLGDPLWVIAFSSKEVDIFAVLEAMAARGWSLNGLHHPPAIHLAVTLRHTVLGVAERFLADLEWSLAEAAGARPGEGSLAPVYGMAASLPARGAVAEMLSRYVDRLYEA